jgi:hypothetical protein
MFLRVQKCGDNVLCARSNANIITTYAIVNFNVFIKDVGKKKPHSPALKKVVPL